MRSLHRWRRPVPAIALIVVACDGGGASKDIERLQSWRATLDLADTARVRGWVTPRYTRQLRDRAREELDAARKTLNEEISAPQRDSLAAAADSLEQSLAVLERAGP